MFDSGLKDRFGHKYFLLLKDHLIKMANAYNISNFDDAFNDCKHELQKLGNNDIGIIEKLNKYETFWYIFNHCI